MSSPAENSSRISADERTSIMLTAGYQEVERIARERRLKPKDIAFEYGIRLAYKIWDIRKVPDDASESQFKDAVLGFMGDLVDREMKNWGHTPSREAAPVRDTVRSAMAASQAAVTDGTTLDIIYDGEVWAVIQVTPENKDLIRSLAANVVGSFDPLDCTYVVCGGDLVEGLPSHVPTQRKVIEAFVAPLRAQGFVVEVRTVFGEKDATNG